MKTLIDGKWTRHPELTGVQRYATELTAALGRLGLDHELARPRGSTRPGTLLWEQLVLPGRARGFDVLFCPANMAPLRLDRRVALVVTLHCLRFHFHPENYSPSFVRWYRWAVPRILRRADAVLTYTRTTADEIEAVYPQARGKLRAISPGVSSAFRPEGPAGDAALGPEPYWLFVGNARPAKNLAILLEALGRTRAPWRLALAGVRPSELPGGLGPELAERLIPLGHFSETERLASIVRGALGILSPSLYESFDFPTLEAMACGIPVLASDTPTHREVCGPAALLLPPERAEPWAQALDSTGASAERRAELGRLGLNRSGDFSWDRCAREVVEVLNAAHGARRAHRGPTPGVPAP